MASSKLVSSSSRSRNSDLSRRPSSNSPATKPKPSATPSSSSAHPQTLNNHSNGISDYHSTNTTSSMPIGSMTIDGLLYDPNPTPMTDATLLDAQITLINTDAAAEMNSSSAAVPQKTVDEVWREIVSGEARKGCKEEVPDDLMTLEDFLARAGAVEEDDIKDMPLAMPPPETERLSGGVFSFDPMPQLSPFSSIDKVEGSIIGFGDGVEMVGSGGVGRGKRGRAVLEPMDKVAQQRQRRMIKNRESAARSRERKQAYQAELESLAVRLEEENEQLLKEKTERTEERRKQLMEKVIPVVEKRRPARALRRVHSLQW
ncbi:PREDICTED: G-box-binding factor 4 [Prunus dulcis]|uniref:PREDICTED: G-box-binding factor 4 n=1 Tax=Prunus dulcis TaxID=3755 RepID=A0A5E4FNJ8_PRUDU|nr:G-box-binding factor 4-like [Prunus dulcis]KAI5312208.1 hypothetical protein L3X38_041381 [Prunus dulcis]VVA29040.1 PREDICTED: G-box-binding factor 4 [Prunus dulcis]